MPIVPNGTFLPEFYISTDVVHFIILCYTIKTQSTNNHQMNFLNKNEIIKKDIEVFHVSRKLIISAILKNKNN